ncbi:syntaxin-8 [Silurus meridionalis]|nr:syntaxin-8 [Silurus meridionalis]
MSQDLWLQNYDATCRLAQEIAENIQERNRQQRTGGNPAKLNMTLRASLQKLKQNITQLRETLARASSQRRISALLTGGFGAEPAQNPWLVNESEETRGLTFREIKEQQQCIIQVQDEGLEVLAEVISRQKRMGQDIGNELDEHNGCRKRETGRKFPEGDDDFYRSEGKELCALSDECVEFVWC